MGFGHRIYRAYDPRAAALREVAEQMGSIADWLKLAVAVEDVALRMLKERYPDHPVMTNVEYYTAAVLQGVGPAARPVPGHVRRGAHRRLDRPHPRAGRDRQAHPAGRALHGTVRTKPAEHLSTLAQARRP